MNEYEQIMQAMKALLPAPTAPNYLKAFTLLCGSEFYNPNSSDLAEMDRRLNAGDSAGVIAVYQEANPNYVLTPRAHIMMASAQKQLEDKDLTELYMITAKSVFDAILATGDGSQKNPWLISHLQTGQDVVELILDKKSTEADALPDGDRSLLQINCTDGAEYFFDITVAIKHSVQST